MDNGIIQHFKQKIVLGGENYNCVTFTKESSSSINTDATSEEYNRFILIDHIGEEKQYYNGEKIVVHIDDSFTIYPNGNGKIEHYCRHYMYRLEKDI